MNPITFGLPISKYASTQRKLAIRTICSTFFDYWVVKKSIPYPHHTKVKLLADMSSEDKAMGQGAMHNANEDYWPWPGRSPMVGPTPIHHD